MRSAGRGSACAAVDTERPCRLTGRPRPRRGPQPLRWGGVHVFPPAAPAGGTLPPGTEPCKEGGTGQAIASVGAQLRPRAVVHRHRRRRMSLTCNPLAPSVPRLPAAACHRYLHILRLPGERLRQRRSCGSSRGQLEAGTLCSLPSGVDASWIGLGLRSPANSQHAHLFYYLWFHVPTFPLRPRNPVVDLHIRPACQAPPSSVLEHWARDGHQCALDARRFSASHLPLSAQGYRCCFWGWPTHLQQRLLHAPTQSSIHACGSGGGRRARESPMVACLAAGCMACVPHRTHHWPSVIIRMQGQEAGSTCMPPATAAAAAASTGRVLRQPPAAAAH